MAAVYLFAVAGETSDWVTVFLAVSAVAQTVLLAWLAKVPRWGAKPAAEARSDDREAAAAGRRRARPDA